MPEISKCPSCEKAILQSLEHLAKTANDAVFNIASTENADKDDDQNQGEDEEPVQVENANDVAELQQEIDSFDENECQKVEKMFAEIWGWQRHDVLLH